MSLWDDKTAAQATGGSTLGSWQASRVSIDSRTVQDGDLFVAIKGDNFDGHTFAAKALEAGAASVMVSQPAAAPALIVKDTMAALEDLGRFSRARSNARIVGVTGSVGKTSAKEMLRIALAAHGETYATHGNLNNHIGTPLNLANLPVSAKYGIFEMGMNHAHEISALTRQVRPHVAVITNIESVHLEFFESIEGIADAKAEIFESMEAGCSAVLNSDNAYFKHLASVAQKRGLNIIACGQGENAPCRLIDYKTTRTGCEITASVFGKKLHYTLAAVGKHWGITSLLALGTAHALGLDIAKTAAALASFSEPKGRGQILYAGGVTLIDDSYNASPAAMRAAFAKTREVWEAAGRVGRKIAALGNMLELGEHASALHAELAGDLEKQGFHAVFTAGNLMQSLQEALPKAMRGCHVANSAELTSVLAMALRAGDIVLIKGSHGSKIYEVAASLPQVLEEKGNKNAV